MKEKVYRIRKSVRKAVEKRRLQDIQEEDEEDTTLNADWEMDVDEG